MREIAISSKGVTYRALVDDEDLDQVMLHRWHLVVKRSNPNCRWARTSVTKNGKREYAFLHRLILGLPKGDIREVDHRDGDGLNNVRANLRIATGAENRRNKKPATSKRLSRFKGVRRREHLSGPRWYAEIEPNSQYQWIGSFPSEEEAAMAYNIMARRYFGEFAYLNAVEMG